MITQTTKKTTKKLVKVTKEEVEVKLDCYRFEDYYPGDAYVDIMGFTFYNRGKATSGRLRIKPRKIVDAEQRKTLDRLKKIGKPIIVDEVGTTAIRYKSGYNAKLSKELYETDFYKKNAWLSELKTFLQEEPSIVGTLYFNVDYTDGLAFPRIGEADRAIINLHTDKIYY